MARYGVLTPWALLPTRRPALERINDARFYEPADLGQKVASLRLGRPRLQPPDVSESDICVDLVAVRYEEARNLSEILELRSRRVDVDESDIVGLWRPMQDLERREASITFDDGVFLVYTIPHKD